MNTGNNENVTIETIKMLYQDTLKYKINAAKTLENQILKLKDNPTATEIVLTGRIKFEIESKN